MRIGIVNRGKVQIYSEDCSLIQTIGKGDAIHTDLKNDGSLILITTMKGKVELWTEDGSLLRTIDDLDAQSAKFNGDNILILTRQFHLELRGERGELLRIL
jgi:hypothetical protein